MTDLEQLADGLDKAAKDIVEWARSRDNFGPHADAAFQTNIHISAAFRILAGILRAKQGNENAE